MTRLLALVLRLLLPAVDREHVVAELEELRAIKARERGEKNAEAWMRRQEINFLWRLLVCRKEPPRNPAPAVEGGMKRRRSAVRPPPVGDWWHHVYQSARILRRSPSFLVLSVLSLALGLGAATSIFSIANGVLLRAPSFPEPHRLVGIFHGEMGNHSYPNFLTLREETSSFLDLAAYSESWYGENADKPFLLEEGLDAAPVGMGLVSGEYFSVLGVAPALGRPLLPEDNLTEGGTPVAVLGWSFWQRKFGGDPAVIGREIHLSGTTYEVVGVAPEGFVGATHLNRPDFWIPAVMRRAIEPPEKEFDIVTHPDWHWISILGRLKPGVSLEVAQARLDQIVASSPSVSEGMKEDSVTVAPLREATMFPPLRERTARYLQMLLIAVGLLVLVVSVNVTNLFLGRMDERQAEISVRQAMGAGRGTLARQFLIEAGLVAALGGAGALLLSRWLADLLFGLMARSLSLSAHTANLTPDLRVLGFTFLLVMASSLAVAGAALLRHRHGNLVSPLMPGTRVSERRVGVFSLQNLLVTAQISLSIMLLVGAGLMVRSYQRLQDQDFGLDYQNTTVLSLDNERIPLGPDDGPALYDRILERVRGLPQVAEASMAKVAPLSGITWGGSAEFEGYDPAEGERTHASENYVDPGFFEMMGIDVLQGRGFSGADGPGTESVVIVNETLADRYWAGRNPLGKTIRWRDGQVFRVVGVVKDHFYSSLRRGVEPLTYFPLAQQFLKNPVILARGLPTSQPLVSAIRQAVREVHPDVILFRETTIESQVGASASRERVTAALLLAYAGLALLLATIGTYGVASRMVVRRWKEIGIRTALGAQRSEVASLVFNNGMRVVAFGLVTGLVCSLAVGVLLRSLIFGVAPIDPLTLAAVGATLLVAGAAACLVPVRRALRADPAEVLRGE